MNQFILLSAALLVSLSAQAQTNTSLMSQTGNAQSATAVQSGSYNESTIRQFTGSSTTVNVGNVASTSQTGYRENYPAGWFCRILRRLPTDLAADGRTWCTETGYHVATGPITPTIRMYCHNHLNMSK